MSMCSPQETANLELQCNSTSIREELLIAFRSLAEGINRHMALLNSRPLIGGIKIHKTLDFKNSQLLTSH